MIKMKKRRIHTNKQTNKKPIQTECAAAYNFQV